MKKVLIFFIFISTALLNAQDGNNLWYFGTSVYQDPTIIPSPWINSSYGLDFSGGGDPVEIWHESGISFYESVSVASNADGDVLFYSDGIQVIDASHELMAGAPLQLQGSQQGSTASAVQGAYILRVPQSDSEYILFTTGAEDGSGTGLRFHEIDLSLQGNADAGDPPLGEVTSFDNLLEASSGEMMTSYGVCGSDSIWIIAHQRSSYNFIRVLVTKDGIQGTPDLVRVEMRNGGPGSTDISTIATLRGSLDINSEGTNLIYTGGAGSGTFIMDFNRNTGDISNARRILNPNGDMFNGYGSEFSPDGTRAYFSHHTIAGIFQYDVQTENSVWINENRVHGEIITGPDDKLYIGKPFPPAQRTLGRIEFPNNDVASIGYDYDAISFAGVPGAGFQYVSFAMPQGFVCNVSTECLINSVGDQCNDDSPIQLTANPIGGTFGPASASYITSGGMFDPSLASISAPNLVTYDNGCDEPDSMFIVVNECCPNIDPDLGIDITICGDTTETLNVVGSFNEIKWFKDGVLQVASTGKNDFVASSGTYRVEVENADGCTGSDEIIISAHAVPNPTIIGDDFYCAGSDVFLEVAAGFDSYVWSPSGGNLRQATFNSAGTFTVTVEDANGCKGTDDVTLTERALPTPTIAGSEVVCEESSIQLSVTTSGGTFVWDDTSNDVSPRSVTTGATYSVTETLNGCEGKDSHDVTFENSPSVDLGKDTAICPDQQQIEIGVTETEGYTSSWNTFDSTGTLLVSNAGVYVITVKSSAGCETKDTIEVFAHTLPTVEIVSLSGETFYCAGSDVGLTTDAVFNAYDWSSGGDEREETVSSASNYTVTVTDGNGCTATDDIDITENELPSIDLGGDKTVCGNDSITLDATHDDADTYLWTPNNEDSPTIRVSSENATYGVTIIDLDGCEFSTSIDVTKENSPTVDIGGDAIICDNVTKTLDAGSGSGYSYTWYLDNELLPNNGQTLDADSGIYRVVVSTENGCEASDTAYLDNHQLPEVTLNSDYEFCAGDSVEVDAGPNGTDYSWNNEETTQSFFVKTGGSLTVEITDGNNCTNEASATITENVLPVVNLAASDSACDGREIELDVTLPNGRDYKWSDGTFGPINTQFGPGTISVVVTNVKGCVDSAEMVVKELDSLDMSAFDDKHQVCFRMEDETPYVAGSFEEAVYDWTLPDGGLEEGQSIVPYLNGTYTLNVTDKFNCIGTHEFENAVIKVPFIDLGPDTSFCSLGKEVYNVRMEIEDMNVKGKLTWEDSYGRTNNNNENDTIFTVKDAPITIFGTLTDDETGCYTGATLEIEENCDSTPVGNPPILIIGGDPITPPGVIPPGKEREDVMNNILWSEYEIFNRWGLKVFQSKNLLPEWDGYFENERVSPGVYYFIYKYEDSSRKSYYNNGFFQIFFEE